MKASLICMDIDGTLVNDDKIIPCKNITALKKASDMGIRLALVSGRYPAGIRHVEEQLGKRCIKAAIAGAYIFDDNKCLYSRHISTETAHLVHDIAKKAGGDCWFFSGESWYVTGMNKWVRAEMQYVAASPDIVSIDELDNIILDKNAVINKALVTGSCDTVKKIYGILGGMELNAQLGFSSDTYLEVIPKGVDKGTALERLCEIYDIPIENTVAFGDEGLDIPLIEKAGIGIAMGNAVKKLKDKADYITTNNNEAGIAYALQDLKII